MTTGIGESRRGSLNEDKPHIYWGKYVKAWCVSGIWPSDLYTKAAAYARTLKAPEHEPHHDPGYGL